MDPLNTAYYITAPQQHTTNSKFNNTISTGSKAKNLVGKSSKVYVDASITSGEEAQARVASLMEKRQL